MQYRSSRTCLLAFVALCIGSGYAAGADWPMWRFDAGRTAASPEELPARLHFQWIRHFPPRVMVWPDKLNQDRITYDRVFEPVVTGKTLLLGFNDSDKVLALDTDSAEERWAFYADGPVRLPPAVDGDKVFFVSDDGYLYCLDVATGALQWRFRGGPTDRKVLGNERLISMWPARGGPVIRDGILYFAASLWPFMGTFIYALQTDTGKIVWRNDGTGAQWINQPHRNPAFAGVAPQGALAIAGDALLVPGGRSVPACFDAGSGAFRYFHFDEDRENSYGHTGGSFVCAAGGVFFNHQADKEATAYALEDGYQLAAGMGGYPVLTEDVFYMAGKRIEAYDAKALRTNPRKRADSRLWTCSADATGDLIKAGGFLYAAGEDGIAAVQLPVNGEEPQVAWSIPVDGQIERLLAADGKLFAVTLDGRILAFGAEQIEVRELPREGETAQPTEAARAQARTILEQTGVKEGYALLYGVGDRELLEALALESQLTLIGIEAVPARLDVLRRRYDARALYGKRIALIPGDLSSVDLSPYLASLTVVAEPASAKLEASGRCVQRIFDAMRPYGGKAWLPATDAARGDFLPLAVAFPGLQAAAHEDSIVFSREGPLPGAAYWTHQYGDVGNTVKSDDRLVRAPLGLLWFGGTSNEDVLPRHGHGPSPLVIGGRLFIEGVDCLSARDVFTGRRLWKTVLGDLGTLDVYYDHTYLSKSQSQQHIPGANARGSNLAATMDEVYILQGGSCVVLAAETGERLRTIELPKGESGETPQWGYIGLYGDYLVAGCDFAAFSKRFPEEEDKSAKRDTRYTNYDKTASMQLRVMNRNTGEILWGREARHGFIHNGIAVGNDTVFCLDRLPPYLEKTLERRGEPVPKTFRLLALDIRTGEPRWEKQEDVFGAWLGYSEKHGLLLQATRPSGDMVLGEEGRRMIVYRAESGEVVWDKARNYSNPPILHGDEIITDSTMFSLLNGEPVLRSNPLTGNPMPWGYERTKGCGYHIASENLITFRSSAAAYCDLTLDGGTGHLGGFKSGCSPNLVAADGVLSAPDYTRTCTCSYQNQTSLALIHMPDVEVWTNYPPVKIDGPILRLGLNLGASGDRRTEDGTLWLEYPVVADVSPDIDIDIEPKNPEWFTHHSAFMADGELPWVSASGAEGITGLKVRLSSPAQQPRPYTVRLYFAEHQELRPGERVFSVQVQGQTVLPDFDVLEAAGQARCTVVREFRGVLIGDVLAIHLLPSANAANQKPILCGVEAVAEEQF